MIFDYCDSNFVFIKKMHCNIQYMHIIFSIFYVMNQKTNKKTTKTQLLNLKKKLGWFCKNLGFCSFCTPGTGTFSMIPKIKSFKIWTIIVFYSSVSSVPAPIFLQIKHSWLSVRLYTIVKRKQVFSLLSRNNNINNYSQTHHTPI